MTKHVLLVNPTLPNRRSKHPANYLDSIIAFERGLIDRFIFDRLLWDHYQSLGIERTFHQYPEQTASLGLLYLAAVLQEAGHQVDYVQITPDESNVPAIIEQARQYDIVGATAICTTIHQSLNLLASIKEKHGHRVTTVIGGPHVSNLDWDNIGDMAGVDILVRGEGEIPILRIAENPTSFSNLSRIDGIVYRRGSEILRNEGFNLLSEQHLQQLPVPAFGLIPDLSNTQIYVQFSRGCTHRCFFCCENNEVRYFTGSQMAETLVALETVRQRNLIFVVDSTFTNTPLFVGTFEKAVRHSGTTNYFNVQTRIDNLRSDMLHRLYKAHIVNYFFGIENTSDQVLHTANKKLTWDDIVQGFQKARAFYVNELGYEIVPCRANFIQGLPGEDVKQQSINLERRRYLLEHGLILQVNDSIYQPTPGSVFFENRKRYGLSLPETYETALRGSLPAYGFQDTSAGQMAIFLYHLEMRQTANDCLVDRFELHDIRSTTEAFLREGIEPEGSFHYVRC